jgi:hypothetical protein
LRPALAALEQRRADADRIFVDETAVPAFRYYWRGRPEPWIAGPRHWPARDPASAADLRAAAQCAVLRSLRPAGALWLIISHLPERERSELIAPLQTAGRIDHVTGTEGSWVYRLGPAIPPASCGGALAGPGDGAR